VLVAKGEFMDWIDMADEEPGELQTVLVSTAAGGVTAVADFEDAWVVEFAPWESPPESSEEVVVTRRVPLPPPLSRGGEGTLRWPGGRISRGGSEL
jgi:hypothetical protein